MHDPEANYCEPLELERWEVDAEAEDRSAAGAIAQAKLAAHDKPAAVLPKRQIAADLGAMGTTVEAWFADIDTGATFLGLTIEASSGSVPGVHKLLVRRLALVEQRLMSELGCSSVAECARQLGLYSVSGLRLPRLATGGGRVSMHCFGLAIDVNYRGNPFLQSREKAAGVIGRATQLVSGTPVDVLSYPFHGDAGKTWDRLRRASEDLKVYLQLGKPDNASRLAALAARSGRDVASWAAQIAADYKALYHRDAFVKRDPARGFLDLDRRLVVALVETGGLLWGGVYASRGAGKDLMHFDWRGPRKDRSDPKSWLQVGPAPAPKVTAAVSPSRAHPKLRRSTSPTEAASATAPGPETMIPRLTSYAPIALGKDCTWIKDHDGKYQCGAMFALPARTGIFFPERMQDTQDLDVIVYLHGHLIPLCGGRPTDQIDRYWRNPRFLLREGVNRTGRSFVLVAPSLGPKSQSGLLHRTGGFDAYMTQVLASIVQQGSASGLTKPRDIGRIIVACHSGGGSTMRAIATGGGTYARRIRECWGFDCLYSDGDVEAWETWARANPDARLYVHYTLTAGTAKRSERLRDKGLPNVVIPTPPQQDHHCDVPTTYWQRRIQAALRSAATS